MPIYDSDPLLATAAPSAAANDRRVRIDAADDDALDAVLQDRFDARRRPPLVIAWFERHVERAAARRFARDPERRNLGMFLAHASGVVGGDRDDLAVRSDDDRADRRVRRRNRLLRTPSVERGARIIAVSRSRSWLVIIRNNGSSRARRGEVQAGFSARHRITPVRSLISALRAAARFDQLPELVEEFVDVAEGSVDAGRESGRKQPHRARAAHASRARREQPADGTSRWSMSCRPLRSIAQATLSTFSIETGRLLSATRSPRSSFW